MNQIDYFRFSPQTDVYTAIIKDKDSTVGYVGQDGKFHKENSPGSYKYFSERRSVWHMLGNTPVIKAFSGTIRAFLGLIDLINALCIAVFKKDYEAAKSIAYAGGQNLLRGIIEAILDVAFITIMVIQPAFIFPSLPSMLDTARFIVCGLYLTATTIHSIALYTYDKKKDFDQVVHYQ